MYKPECGIPENFGISEYLNIFESTNLHEQMSKYIHLFFTRTNVGINIHRNKFDTNECPNKYLY